MYVVYLVDFPQSITELPRFEMFSRCQKKVIVQYQSRSSRPCIFERIARVDHPSRLSSKADSSEQPCSADISANGLKLAAHHTQPSPSCPKIFHLSIFPSITCITKSISQQSNFQVCLFYEKTVDIQNEYSCDNQTKAHFKPLPSFFGIHFLW